MIVSLFKWDTPYVPAVEEFLGEKLIECRTRAAALQALPDADVILTSGGAELLDEELVAAAGKLRLVLSISAGVEKLPLKALHERDVAVCNARGVYSSTIAEYVIGGLLAWTHSFPVFFRNQAAARWKPVISGDGLEGKTLLIIGAGSIGTEIARKARAFDMTVIGLRKTPAPAEFFHEVLGVGELRKNAPPCRLRRSCHTPDAGNAASHGRGGIPAYEGFRRLRQYRPGRRLRRGRAYQSPPGKADRRSHSRRVSY